MSIKFLVLGVGGGILRLGGDFIFMGALTLSLPMQQPVMALLFLVCAALTMLGRRPNTVDGTLRCRLRCRKPASSSSPVCLRMHCRVFRESAKCCCT